jgi:hypothetical protein
MSTNHDRLNAITPPPVAQVRGAVDLGALRGPAPGVKSEAVRAILIQAGLACPCGSPIESGGVELVVLREGLQNTPQGPAKGVGLNGTAFCGQECPAFQSHAASALQDADVLVVVAQQIVERVWLKKVDA